MVLKASALIGAAGWLGVARNGTAIHSLSLPPGKRPPQKGLLKNDGAGGGRDGTSERTDGRRPKRKKAPALLLYLSVSSGCYNLFRYLSLWFSLSISIPPFMIGSCIVRQLNQLRVGRVNDPDARSPPSDYVCRYSIDRDWLD